MSPYVQPSLFDAKESRRRRNAGREKAASRYAGWLELARSLAVRICEEQGTCTADDLRAAGLRQPHGAHYNIWGSVFVDDRFELDGYVQSKRPVAHANLIRRWRLTRPSTLSAGGARERYGCNYTALRGEVVTK